MKYFALAGSLLWEGVAESVSVEGADFSLVKGCLKNTLWKTSAQVWLCELPSLGWCVPSWLPFLLVYSITFVLSLPCPVRDVRKSN